MWLKFEHYLNDRFETGLDCFVKRFRKTCFLDDGQRSRFIVNKCCHDVHRCIRNEQDRQKLSSYGYWPIGTRPGPNSPRCSIITLSDFKIEESIKPRRPSAVPDDCIMRWSDRKVCFKTAARATGSSPVGRLTWEKSSPKNSSYRKIHTQQDFSARRHAHEHQTQLRAAWIKSYNVIRLIITFWNLPRSCPQVFLPLDRRRTAGMHS